MASILSSLACFAAEGKFFTEPPPAFFTGHPCFCPGYRRPEILRDVRVHVKQYKKRKRAMPSQRYRIVPRVPHDVHRARTPDERYQMLWENMMLEAEKSSDPAEVLKRHAQGGNIVRGSLVGTFVRLRELKYYDTIIKFIDWLIEEGWYPLNQKDYALLILACSKEGKTERIELALEQMKEAGIPANIEIYTMQIEAYARKGYLQKAEAVFQMLLSSGPAPTVVTYHTLMRSYSEARRLQDVERLFKLATSENSGIQPDSRMYTLALHAFAKRGRLREAKVILATMKREKVPVTTVTYNILLSCQRNCQGVYETYLEMLASKVYGDAFTYTIILNAYGKAGEIDEAQTAFLKMFYSKMDQIKPTLTTFNALINMYAKNNYPDKAEAAFAIMTTYGVIPDIITYTSLIDTFVKDKRMDTAEEYVMKMRETGLAPDLHIHTLLMYGYAKIDDIENMLVTFDKMKNAGLRPDRYVYTVLMNAYAYRGDFDATIMWFKEMGDAGYKPNFYTRKVLLRAAKDEDQKAEVNELLIGLGNVDAPSPWLDSRGRLQMTDSEEESDQDVGLLEDRSDDETEEGSWTEDLHPASEEQDGDSFLQIGAASEAVEEEKMSALSTSPDYEDSFLDIGAASDEFQAVEEQEMSAVSTSQDYEDSFLHIEAASDELQGVEEENMSAVSTSQDYLLTVNALEEICRLKNEVLADETLAEDGRKQSKVEEDKQVPAAVSEKLEDAAEDKKKKREWKKAVKSDSDKVENTISPGEEAKKKKEPKKKVSKDEEQGQELDTVLSTEQRDKLGKDKRRRKKKIEEVNEEADQRTLKGTSVEDGQEDEGKPEHRQDEEKAQQEEDNAVDSFREEEFVGIS